MPLVRRVRLQRLEQPLDVAVDVSDDQDGEIVRGGPSLLRSFGAKPAPCCPQFRLFGAGHAECRVDHVWIVLAG